MATSSQVMSRAYPDNTAYTAQQDTGSISLAVRNDTLNALAVSDGNYAPLQTDSSGALYTNVNSFTPGTAAASLGKAEDAAHSSGDTGVMSLVVRNDTLAALADTDGDYAPLQVDVNGALYATSDQDEATGIVGRPFLAGRRAAENMPDAQTDGDAVIALGDLEGRTIVGTAPRGNVVPATLTISNTDATTLFAAQGVDLFADLSYLLLCNTDVSDTKVDVSDGTSTVITINVVAASTETVDLAMCPWPQATANSAWTVTSGTAVTDLQVSALAIVRK